MSNYETHKRTPQGKRTTLERRTIRAAKYGTATQTAHTRANGGRA